MQRLNRSSGRVLLFSNLFRFGPCEKRRGAKNDRIAKRRAREREAQRTEETELIPGERQKRVSFQIFSDAPDVRANTNSGQRWNEQDKRRMGVNIGASSYLSIRFLRPTTEGQTVPRHRFFLLTMSEECGRAPSLSF